jgi:large subunit ribosomal protein L4
MSTIDVLDPSGAKAGTAELPPELFDVTANIPLIHQVVVAQLAAARQGTHSTKGRGEVRAAARSRTGRRGRVGHGRARYAHRSTWAAASCTVRSRMVMPSAPRRR